MNKEDYVSLEVAKLLKEKGFDEPTLKVFHDNNIYDISYCRYGHDVFDGDFYLIPTLYEAAKWLRNKYDINVFVFTCLPCCFDNLKEYDDTRYTPCVVYNKKDGNKVMYLHRNLTDFNYEKVYNDGILEALKLI